jgi:hypothetical protein
MESLSAHQLTIEAEEHCSHVEALFYDTLDDKVVKISTVQNESGIAFLDGLIRHLSPSERLEQLTKQNIDNYAFKGSAEENQLR